MAGESWSNLRRIWRRLVPPLAVLALVAGMGCFAWMSHHPEDSRLVRAEGWPVVGPLVAKVRDLYLPPRQPSDAAEVGAPREVWIPLVPRPEPPEPVVVDTGSPRTWVPPGTVLYTEPRLDAPVVATVPTYAEVGVLEQRPADALAREERPAHWYRVIYGRQRGWVRLVEPAAGEPPLGRAPEPVVPLPGQPPDSRRLELALDLLGPQRRSLPIGSYLLYTDVDDALLLQRLEAVAEGLEPAYRRRFGVGLVGDSAEAVVLFETRDDYRAYQRAWTRLGGLRVAGHAGHGLVAFYRQNRLPRELLSTLVHELTHLLNRRALGPALPPWLDEGMAEDLTWAEIDVAGRIQPGTWGGDRLVEEEGRSRSEAVTGGLAVYRRLPLLAETLDRGRGVPVRQLVTRDWETFMRRNRPLHYQLSGLLVRFLVEDPELAPRFRRFLTDTAAGEPLTPERLRTTLGLSWEELDRRLAAWVEEAGAGA